MPQYNNIIMSYQQHSIIDEISFASTKDLKDLNYILIHCFKVCQLSLKVINCTQLQPVNGK